MRRRAALVVSGAVLLALAGIAVMAGIALAVVFKGGNALASGPQPVTTSTRAVVSAVAQLDGNAEAPSGLGEARMQVDVTARDGGHGVFVGVAPAADVERYLAGADVDLVTDVQLQPLRLTTRHRPGTEAVPAPGSQGFWLARARTDGGTARLTWPARDGDYRLVVMNADASPGVDVDARVAFVVPSASRITTTVLVVGIGTALLGVVLLTVGLLGSRSSRGPSSAEPVPAGASRSA